MVLFWSHKESKYLVPYSKGKSLVYIKLCASSSDGIIVYCLPSFIVERVGLVVNSISALHPEGLWFESHSSQYLGTLGKSFTHSCL